MYWAIPLLLLFHNCKQDLTSLKVVLFYSPFCGFCFLDIFFQNDSLIITVSCISLTRCPLLSFPNTWLLPWQLAPPPRTQFNNGSSSTLWLWGHSCAVIQMCWCVFKKELKIECVTKHRPMAGAQPDTLWCFNGDLPLKLGLRDIKKQFTWLVLMLVIFSTVKKNK